MTTKIDALSAKAKRQAERLNRTLDKLSNLGVTASVYPAMPVFGGHISIERVRLVITQPAHKRLAKTP